LAIGLLFFGVAYKDAWPEKSQLDVAVLAGDLEDVVALRKQGMVCSCKFVPEDFLQPAKEGPKGGALGFHLGWSLKINVLEAAIRSGVCLGSMTVSPGSGARSRHRISILDVAILAGQWQQAAALAEAGIASFLGPSLVGYMFVQDQTGNCELDLAAVESALAANIGLEAMPVEILDINFDYPMKKAMRQFCLLDVVVCLGHQALAKRLAHACAEKVAVQGSIHSCLTEAHLNCTTALFPLLLWLTERKLPLPEKNSMARTKAAVTAAAVLDEVRCQVLDDYMVLLAQWNRLWTCRRSGSVHVIQTTLLRHILAFSLPKILLTTRCLAHLMPRRKK